MYTAQVDVYPENVRQILLAAARLEMQGMVAAIMENVLDWEMAAAAG